MEMDQASELVQLVGVLDLLDATVAALDLRS
jgi:hypothetical protein